MFLRVVEPDRHTRNQPGEKQKQFLHTRQPTITVETFDPTKQL